MSDHHGFPSDGSAPRPEAKTSSNQPGRQARKPRLWIASELYFPEETSTGYFITRIAEGLTSDFDVCVISGRPAYSERGRKVRSQEARNGVRIFRMMSPRFDKDRLVFRLINAAVYSVATFLFSLFCVRSNDIVLVVTTPPTLPISIAASAWIRRAARILLVHDVYPEILFASGYLRRESLSAKLLTFAFRINYRSFHRIVAIGRDMADLIKEKIQSGGPPVSVIPNWGAVDDIRPMSRYANPFRADHGLMDKIIVQFSGNIGRTHDVEIVLELANTLRHHEDIHILFVGFGGKQAFVFDEIRRRGLTNVTLLPRQPAERLNEMLCASDLTIVSFVDGMYGLSVPSRMYNIMAAAVPIAAVMPASSELGRVLIENDAGWVISPRSLKELEAIVLGLKSESGLAEAQRRGANGRAAAVSHYNPSAVIASYRQILADVLRARGA